ELAPGEPGRQLARLPGDTVAGRLEHGVDRLLVEPLLPRLPLQLGLGGGGLERPPVGPVLAHRAVAVRGREDPGGPVERGAAKTAVVARPVEPLVVGSCERADRTERLRLRERALGEVRVQADALPVPEPERAGLLPDRVRDADPAE